jgi:hypothetical protein
MEIEFSIKIKGLSPGFTGASLDKLRQISLRIDGYQLLFGSGDQCCLFGCFGRRLGVKGIKDRGANKDGEKEGDDVHTGAK